MYLYIFEDSTLRQSNNKPTQNDLNAVNEGVLNIIKFTNGEYYEYGLDGNLEEIEFVSDILIDGYTVP